MTVFTYIGKNITRIKQDVKIGITSYCVIKHWSIYSRYKHYKDRGNNVSMSVLFTAQDFQVSENWIYTIIKKMEAEI